MAYWLIKSPFRSRTWAKVVAAGQFQLYGIRSAQARQAISQIQPGDEAFFYFQKTIWGVMCVTEPPITDPTSADEKWLSVTFTPTKTLESPVLLSTLRASAVFAHSPLIRQPRLSVIAITTEQWQAILTNPALGNYATGVENKKG